MKILIPIRVRLTFYYTLIVVITFLIFGTIAFLSIEKQLFNSLDSTLKNETEWLQKFIEPKARRVKLNRELQRRKFLAEAESLKTFKLKPAKEIDVEGKDSLELDSYWNQIYEHTLLSPKKQKIQIVDRNGEILYKWGMAPEERLYFGDIPFNTSKLATIYDSFGTALRVSVSQNKFSKIIVAYPEEDIGNVLGQLFSILIYLVPLAIIFSVLGGWFLAKRSLAKVDEITKTARKITAQNLNEKIPIVEVDDEIGRLSRTFNEMITRLQHSFEQVKQFSADASHELRTPLTILRGEIELALQNKNQNSENKRALVSMQEEVFRMTAIIENLLILSKVERGTLINEFIDLPLAPLINEIFEDSKMMAEPKKIKVVLETCDEVSIMGDPIRIRQLIFNLIDNAIKYTNQNGTVSLLLVKDEKNAHIIVMDNGIGISEEDQKKVFDRFYRVDKARSREFGGTGLGLSISKWICEAHKGTISIRSEIGKGTTFTVTIPSI